MAQDKALSDKAGLLREEMNRLAAPFWRESASMVEAIEEATVDRGRVDELAGILGNGTVSQRIEAVRNLGKIPGKLAHSALCRAFAFSAPDKQTGLSPGDRLWVQEVAVEVLGERGDERAVEQLCWLTSGEYIRRASARYDEREQVACYAIKMLGRLGRPDTVEPLRSIAVRTDPYLGVAVQIAAVKALAELKAVEALRDVAAIDWRSDVRFAAVSALESLEPAGDGRAGRPG